MDSLVELALGYQQASSDQERNQWLNKTSSFLLNSSAAAGMVRTMLFKKKKNPDRFPDALQDALVIYVMKYVPTMNNAEAAWGLFKSAIEVVAHRLTRNYYDNELSSSISLDAARDHEETAKDLLSMQIAAEHESTAAVIIDKMTATQAKNRIHEGLLASKMKGKNALSWLPQITKSQDRDRPLPRLEDMPKVVQKRTPSVKVPETPEYERLLEIRDTTGMSIQPFAEALNIGVPRLRSYLSRKSYVHPEVLQRAEQWYAKEGRERHARLKKLTSVPLPDLIDKWKRKTQAPSYAALAHIIGISLPTMVRWRKETGKPMHNSHLLDAEDKVLRHCKLHLSSNTR